MHKDISYRIEKKDLDIFKKEFSDFLPEKIYDFHIHLWKEEFIKYPARPERKIQHPFLDDELQDGFTFEDFNKSYGEIFPGKEIRGLFFGLPLREYDLKKSNDYISDVCKKSGSLGLYIPEPGLGLIPGDFFKDRFIGFKPYPDLVDQEHDESISKTDTDISHFDFISKTVLEFSNENGLIILVHLPRKDRLKDPRNIAELKKISKEYKNIKIVLAHAGRSYCHEDIKDIIPEIKELKNIFVDLAMVNDFLVIRLLLKELGPERVLFGSDSAISLLKGKNIDINNKHYFVTEEPKIWSLSSSDMKLDFTFFIYETLRALKQAAIDLNLSRESIKKVFYLNAEGIISSIALNSKK